MTSQGHFSTSAHRFHFILYYVIAHFFTEVSKRNSFHRSTAVSVHFIVKVHDLGRSFQQADHQHAAGDWTKWTWHGIESISCRILQAPQTLGTQWPSICFPAALSLWRFYLSMGAVQFFFFLCCSQVSNQIEVFSTIWLACVAHQPEHSGQCHRQQEGPEVEDNRRWCHMLIRVAVSYHTIVSYCLHLHGVSHVIFSIFRFMSPHLAMLLSGRTPWRRLAYWTFMGLRCLTGTLLSYLTQI